MLIATFGATTAWAGRRIELENGAYVLEGLGPITAPEIMEHDRQGHLIWVNSGARAWVGSKAMSPAPRIAAARFARGRTTTSVPRTSEQGDLGAHVDTSPSTVRTTRLKRALMLTIAILAVANIVLILAISGVFRG